MRVRVRGDLAAVAGVISVERPSFPPLGCEAWAGVCGVEMRGAGEARASSPGLGLGLGSGLG